MCQFAPPLEVIGLAPRHVRLDRLPTNEEQVQRTVFLLATELAAEAAGGRIKDRQRSRADDSNSFRAGRYRYDDVFEHHARAINRARSFSSFATPIAV